MYLPAHFAPPGTDALHALMRAHPLAVLVGKTADGLDANHIPLHFFAEGEHGVLRGHVARANPLWRTLDGQAVLAVFQGPDAYVSPSWYPSKKENHRAVPTWNYAVVHAHGTLRAVDDAAWLRTLLTAMTAVHEAAQAEPWSLDEAPADYIGKMLAAVVGVEIPLTRLDGKWKASQNQPVPNRAAVTAELDERAPDMAALMRGLRDTP